MVSPPKRHAKGIKTKVSRRLRQSRLLSLEEQQVRRKATTQPRCRPQTILAHHAVVEAIPRPIRALRTADIMPHRKRPRMLDDRRQLILHALLIAVVPVRAEIERGADRDIGGDLAAIIVEALQLESEDFRCVLDDVAPVFRPLGLAAGAAPVALDGLDHVALHVLRQRAPWDARVDGDREGAVWVPGCAGLVPAVAPDGRCGDHLGDGFQGGVGAGGVSLVWERKGKGGSVRGCEDLSHLAEYPSYLLVRVGVPVSDVGCPAHFDLVSTAIRKSGE